MKKIITVSELPAGYAGTVAIESVYGFTTITSTDVEHGVGTNNLTKISAGAFESGYELFESSHRAILELSDQ